MAMPAAALLSPSAQSTGQPIKFVGIGEKYDALEPFHPDRHCLAHPRHGRPGHAHRTRRAECRQKKKLRPSPTKALSGDGFSLVISANNCARSRKMGSLQKPESACCLASPFAGMQKHADKIDEKQITRVEAIIGSMTPHETRPSRSHQRQPPQAHRPRQRHQRAGSQQPPRQYASDEEDVQAMGKPSFARRMAGMKLPGM